MLLSRCALYVSRLFSSLCHARCSVAFVRRRIPRPGKAVVSVRSSTDVDVTLRVVCFSSALGVMPRAFVQSRSFVAEFPVLGRLLVSVRSSTDVVVTLRVVRFSSVLVVMPRACVRSRSFVAVFPVLGRLLVPVRSSTDVVVTLRVVRFLSALVVMPRAYVRSSSFAHSVCVTCRPIVVPVCIMW